MVGVLLTLVAIGLVSYFVIKNYYPPIGLAVAVLCISRRCPGSCS